MSDQADQSTDTKYAKEQENYWHKEQHTRRRDPRHPVIKTYVQSKLDYILRNIELSAKPKILDVGAGNGYFTFYWNKIGAAVALDYSAVILENNPVAQKVVMDARNLDYEDNSFEVSFCHAVLHHIDFADQPKVISEMARVSKKYVIIIEPNRNNPLMSLFGIIKKEERGLLRFSPDYTVKLLQNANLEIISSCSFGFVTPNRMPIPNFILKAIRKLERPMPFGMTNIIIGKKL